MSALLCGLLHLADVHVSNPANRSISRSKINDLLRGTVYATW
ncbi:hypothetical protein [Chitinolyticbacter meiyuanensis]|nr:hypothetical protein [Chitinolyticbacter meiyuanensis]